LTRIITEKFSTFSSGIQREITIGDTGLIPIKIFTRIRAGIRAKLPAILYHCCQRIQAFFSTGAVPIQKFINWASVVTEISQICPCSLS